MSTCTAWNATEACTAATLCSGCRALAHMCEWCGNSGAEARQPGQCRPRSMERGGEQLASLAAFQGRVSGDPSCMALTTPPESSPSMSTSSACPPEPLSTVFLTTLLFSLLVVCVVLTVLVWCCLRTLRQRHTKTGGASDHTNIEGDAGLVEMTTAPMGSDYHNNP